MKIVKMTTKDLDYINLVDKAARLIKDLEYYIHLVHKAAAGFERIDSNFFLINLFVCLFIYLWLPWAFVAARRLSLIVVSRDYPSLWCTGFSLWWLLLLRSTGSRRAGFSSCGTQAQ